MHAEDESPPPKSGRNACNSTGSSGRRGAAGTPVSKVPGARGGGKKAAGPHAKTVRPVVSTSPKAPCSPRAAHAAPGCVAVPKRAKLAADGCDGDAPPAADGSGESASADRKAPGALPRRTLTPITPAAPSPGYRLGALKLPAAGADEAGKGGRERWCVDALCGEGA